MELNDLLRRLKIAGFILLAILAIGTVGFAYISSGRWIDSFYMTCLSITTIGFHEVIDLSESPGGRIFTVFIAFSGIGIFTYSLSNIAALFIEGDIRRSFQKKLMEKKINKMNNHYIICGCGRVGNNIAEELHLTDRQFVIADRSEEVKKTLDPEVVEAPFLVGDCTNDDFLRDLGVERASGIFVTTGDDNTNLVICLTARQLNSGIKIISRITDLEHEQKMKRAGADKIISPNFMGGLRMASEMVRPTVTSFLDEMMKVSGSRLRLEEIVISEKFDGKEVSELPLEICNDTLLLAIKSDDQWTYNPKSSQKIEAGGRLIVMTSVEDRKLLQDRLED